jgi:hypothetical protein
VLPKLAPQKTGKRAGQVELRLAIAFFESDEIFRHLIGRLLPGTGTWTTL